MKISLILECLFCSFTVSILLFMMSQKLIKNYRLKHTFYQFSFVLLLLLPLICLGIQPQRDPIFTVSNASHQSVDKALILGENMAFASQALNESHEGAMNTSATNSTVFSTHSSKSISQGHLILIIISIYLLLALIHFLKNYLSLCFYCRKLPEFKHDVAGIRSKVLVSKNFNVPFCFGLFKPVIVLPDTYKIGDDKELRLALLHEQGHIKNLDPQFSLIQYFVKVCFFWNPLVMRLNRKFDETQEILADYHACEGTQDPQAYAGTLIQLIKRSHQLKLPALSSGMASSKQQLLVRFNAMFNEKQNMHLSYPILKKAGIAVLTVSLLITILQTGLFAKHQGRDINAPLIVDTEGTENKVHSGSERKEMEVIAVQGLRNGELILSSLDGKVYKVINQKQQLEGGILRLSADVLYCEVTLVKTTQEGGDVILGPYSNGSPMTQEGEALQIKLWPQIKAMKRQLGHDRWLRFHGDQKAP